MTSSKRRLVVPIAALVVLGITAPALAADGTLTGRVVDVDTGGPLGGTTIWAGVGLPTATTNGTGDYSLTLPAASGYNVIADKAGYAKAHRYGVAISAGGSTRLDFGITRRQGSISGQVVDSFGKAVTAHVIADSTEGNGFGNADTDASGFFTITRLAPMSYWVHAFPSDPQRASVAVSGVIVKDGQTTSVTVVITSGNGRVAGTIKFGTGAAASGASVYIDSAETSATWAGRTDASGSYTSGFLSPAKYNVHVSDVTGWANEVKWNVPVTAGQTTNVSFQLSNVVGAIAGFVRDIAGAPVAGAQVDAFSSSSTGPWGWQTVSSGADGWYKLDMLLPSDRYQVFVHAPGRPLLHADFVPVRTGVSTQPLNFTYTFPGRSIAPNPNGGYYALSGDGNVFAYGGAPFFGSPYFGWDIARSIAVMPDGLGYIVLDGYGGVHRFGSATQGAIAPLASPYFGWDIARALAITPTGKGLLVLDGWGGRHVRGDALVLPGPYWRGWDIARAVALSPCGGGLYVLDGFGGVHPSGDAVPRNNPYFGWDIARGIAVTPTNGGYAVLDGWGGIHARGDAPATLPGSYLGADRWRGIAVTSSGYLLVRSDGYSAQF